VAVLIRGDRELSETKLAAVLKCDELLLADDATITNLTKAPVGFAGPIGLPDSLDIFADFEVAAIQQGVVGANKADTHFKNVHIMRDCNAGNKIIFKDLRLAVKGEFCPRCGKGKYESFRGIEVGQVFFLGTKYSDKMGATVLDETGKPRSLIMGCYGIGVGRTMAAAIEQNNDKNGIIWPMAIAPFHVVICPIGDDDEIKKTAEKIYNDLTEKSVEALLDDRGERPGFMFKDADLLGIPIRITVGKKGLKEGKVELKLRKDSDFTLAPVDDIVEQTIELIKTEIARTLETTRELLRKRHES